MGSAERLTQRSARHPIPRFTPGAFMGSGETAAARQRDQVRATMTYTEVHVCVPRRSFHDQKAFPTRTR